MYLLKTLKKHFKNKCSREQLFKILCFLQFSKFTFSLNGTFAKLKYGEPSTASFSEKDAFKIWHMIHHLPHFTSSTELCIIPNKFHKEPRDAVLFSIVMKLSMKEATEKSHSSTAMKSLLYKFSLEHGSFTFHKILKEYVMTWNIGCVSTVVCFKVKCIMKFHHYASGASFI